MLIIILLLLQLYLPTDIMFWKVQQKISANNIKNIKCQFFPVLACKVFTKYGDPVLR